MAFEFFPNTNFHDLNLDYILEKVQNINDNREAAENAAQNAADDAAEIAAILETLNNDVIAYVDNWLETNLSGSNVTLDSSFTLANAAARSSAVGDALFANSDRSNLTPAGLTRFAIASSDDFQTSNTFAAFPVNSYAYTSPSRISNLPSDAPPAALWVFCFKSPANNAIRLYLVTRPQAGYINWGVSTDSGATVSWLNDNATTPVTVKTVEHETFIETQLLDDALQNWYAQGGGTYGADSLRRSKAFRVFAGDYLYFSHTLGSSVACHGVFLDENLEYVGYWNNDDIEAVTYVSNYAPTTTPYTFVAIYRVLVPDGAYYAAANLTSGSNTYKQYFANIPVFAGPVMPPVRFRDSDNPISRYKDKKLAIVGPSTAYIDRAYIGALTQSIIGFPEYLAPYFDGVDVYGVNSGGYMSGATYSIYDNVVTNNKIDFSDYDVLLLISSTNALTTRNIGTALDTDTATYFGGLNGIITEAKTGNPDIEIILTTPTYKSTYWTDSNVKRIVDHIRKEIIRLGALTGYHVIDLATSTNFDEDTYNDLTYDGVHYNQTGMKNVGQAIVNALISGFTGGERVTTPECAAYSLPAGTETSSSGNQIMFDISANETAVINVALSDTSNNNITLFTYNRSGNSTNQGAIPNGNRNWSYVVHGPVSTIGIYRSNTGTADITAFVSVTKI